MLEDNKVSSLWPRSSSICGGDGRLHFAKRTASAAAARVKGTVQENENERPEQLQRTQSISVFSKAYPFVLSDKHTEDACQLLPTRVTIGNMFTYK